MFLCEEGTCRSCCSSDFLCQKERSNFGNPSGFLRLPTDMQPALNFQRLLKRKLTHLVRDFFSPGQDRL